MAAVQPEPWLGALITNNNNTIKKALLLYSKPLFVLKI
jgi:hypothetical protein